MAALWRIFLISLIFSALPAYAQAPPQSADPFELDRSAASKASEGSTAPEALLDQSTERSQSSRAFMDELARSLESRKQWAEAAVLYHRILGTFGPDADVGFKAARGEAFARQYDQAILTLRELLDQFPLYTDASLMLARLYGWNGQYDAAQALLSEVQQREPSNLEPFLVQGDLYYWQGLHDLAQGQYELFLRSYPNDPRALRGAARNFLAMGHWEEAAALLDPLRAVGDLETVAMIEEAWAEMAHAPFRVDVAYTQYLNADRGDWYGVLAAFAYTVSEAARLGVSTEVQHRTDAPGGNTDVFISFFGYFRTAEWMFVEAEVGFAPEPEFRPMVYFLLKQAFVLADAVDFYIYNKLWSFKDAAGPGNNLWINQIGPGVTLHLGPVDFDASYRASLFDDADAGHFVTGRLDVRLVPELGLMAGVSYGMGTDVFYDTAAVTTDVLTATGGVLFDFNARHGLDLVYAFFTSDPNRDNLPVVGLFQHALTAHYHVRF